MLAVPPLPFSFFPSLLGFAADAVAAAAADDDDDDADDHDDDEDDGDDALSPPFPFFLFSSPFPPLPSPS